MKWVDYLTVLLVMSNLTWYFLFKVVRKVAESRREIINQLLEEKNRA
jgi:hypothetical protein